MNVFSYVLLLIFCSVSEGGVTEIPSKSDDEVNVEVVTDDTWMPSNIFDVSPDSKFVLKERREERKEVKNDLPVTDESWDTESSPLLKAIRDFLFAGDDNLLNMETTEEPSEDPTEEIVKMLEKGLIEATTMLLNPPEDDDEPSTTTSEEPISEPISITKIENEGSDTLFDRIGLNLMNFATSDKRQGLSVTNITTSCSTCYDTLETCVKQCFVNHNCNDVQRQARICPPPASRMCNIFTQWSPVDECKEHEDCKSPLLCCSDGCTNKCTTGIWRD